MHLAENRVQMAPQREIGRGPKTKNLKQGNQHSCPTVGRKKDAGSARPWLTASGREIQL